MIRIFDKPDDLVQQPGKQLTSDQALPNLLNATQPGHVQLAEETMGAYRSWQVSVNHEYIPGEFNTKHFRSLHAWLMQDVYPEVGNTRNDELNYESRIQQRNPAHVFELATHRQRSGGELVRLLPAREVNAQLDQLAALLKDENHLMGFTKEEFVGRLAAYYLYYAHASPFTSGSDQVLYLAFRLLGREAGYEVELAQAPQLPQVTDMLLKAGVASEKRHLARVISPVVWEAEGPEAALRRKITMQVVRPKGAPS